MKRSSNSESTLSLDDRIKLIADYPLFCLLNPADVRVLALLIHEQKVESGTIIAKEGDVVDSVYLIFSGTAEVTRTIKTVEKLETIHVANLGKGNAIGLAAGGLFSHLGIRIGTVTATSSMILGVIGIHDFNIFLQMPGVPYPGLKNLCEKVLLMNFLDNTHLFAHLPKNLLEKIVKNIHKISLPAKTLLFSQGDDADKCYFIISGRAALMGTNKDNKEYVVKLFERSDILGEGAFLDNEKRNATIRTETDCEFFILTKEHLRILEGDATFIHSLNKARIGQLRARAKQDINVSRRTTSENDEVIILEHSIEETQLQISHQDYLIWSMLDGKNNLREILNSHPEEFKNLTLYDAYTRVSNMKRAGFAEFEAIDNLTKKSLVGKLIKKTKSVFSIRDKK